jgi:hypothetical protein
MVQRYTGNMYVLPGVYTRKLLKIIYLYFGVHMPHHQTLMVQVLFPCNPGWKNSVSSQ